MKRAAVAVALVIAALAAGSVVLASRGPRNAHSTSSPAATARPRPSLRTDLELTRHVPCGAGYHHLIGPKVFSRFHPVTAVACTEGFHTYRRQGQWEVIVRRVAVRGVPALQRYFEQPDEPNFPQNGICTADLRGVLVPAFVDRHGHALRPRTPVDRCHHPLGLPKGEKPLRLRWHVVWVHRVKEVVTAAAVAAGCPMRWGNSVAWAGPPRDSTGGPLFGVAPKTVRVCIFRTPPGRFAVGYFLRGIRRLGTLRTRRLLTALTGAGPKRDCAKQRMFAVVIRSPGSVASVELGGCWRVDRADQRAGTAKPAVVRTLLGVR